MNRFQEQSEALFGTQKGLVWTKNASFFDFPMMWNEAFAFVKELNH